jgi:hypothetical protein
MYNNISFDSWGNLLEKDYYGNYRIGGNKKSQRTYSDDTVNIIEHKMPNEPCFNKFPHKYLPGESIVVVYGKDDYSPEASKLDANGIYSGMLGLIEKCIPVQQEHEIPKYIVTSNNTFNFEISEEKIIKIGDIPDISDTTLDEIRNIKEKQSLQDNVSKFVECSINDITTDINSLKTDIDIIKTDLSTLTTVDIGTTPTVYRKDETDQAIYDSQQIVKEELTGKIENDIALVKGDITKTNDTVVSTRKISKAALLGNILSRII